MFHVTQRHPSNAVFIKKCESVLSICLGIRKSAEHIRKQKKLFVKNQEGVPDALPLFPVRQRMVKGLLNI